MLIELGVNEQLSLMRPGWTSDNLHACKNLHLREEVVHNYFVETEGMPGRILRSKAKRSTRRN